MRPGPSAGITLRRPAGHPRLSTLRAARPPAPPPDYLSAMPRPTPFDLVFGQLAPERFPAIRTALEAGHRDPADRDAFFMERDVVLLLRELRPDEGLGEGIDQLAALLHHAYLFWESGQPVVALGAEGLRELIAGSEPPADTTDHPRALYAEYPERRVWAAVVEGEPPEPLEGCFLHAAGPDQLRVLGVFGLRPERMGFSVVEAAGPRPARLERPDGTPLFDPTLPGGAAAGLNSLVGAEELLELGWRTRPLAAASLTGAGPWTR